MVLFEAFEELLRDESSNENLFNQFGEGVWAKIDLALWLFGLLDFILEAHLHIHLLAPCCNGLRGIWLNLVNFNMGLLSCWWSGLFFWSLRGCQWDYNTKLYPLYWWLFTFLHDLLGVLLGWVVFNYNWFVHLLFLSLWLRNGEVFRFYSNHNGAFFVSVLLFDLFLRCMFGNESSLLLYDRLWSRGRGSMNFGLRCSWCIFISGFTWVRLLLNLSLPIWSGVCSTRNDRISFWNAFRFASVLFLLILRVSVYLFWC